MNRTIRRLTFALFLGITGVLLLGPLPLEAQRGRGGGPPDEKTIFGTWRGVERSNPPACGPFFVIEEDERQLPRRGCRFDWRDHINARTRAWLAFQDEPVEGKFYCVPESIPSNLARGTVRITQPGGSVVTEQEAILAATIVRTFWTDGRPHLPPGDVAYYGHSIGRYEGDELVVETRNFTFDPNGMDYQLQVPSSWAKRLTERYSLIGPGPSEDGPDCRGSCIPDAALYGNLRIRKDGSGDSVDYRLRSGVGGGHPCRCFCPSIQMNRGNDPNDGDRDHPRGSEGSTSVFQS